MKRWTRNLGVDDKEVSLLFAEVRLSNSPAFLCHRGTSAPEVRFSLPLASQVTAERQNARCQPAASGTREARQTASVRPECSVEHAIRQQAS